MSATCPYCYTAIDTATTNVAYCNACGTPHHADCYNENGGCTVFGCRCAPADEPKLQVTGAEIAQAPAVPAAAPAAAAPPPLASTAAPPPPGPGGMQLPGNYGYAYGDPRAAALMAAMPAEGYRRSRIAYVMLGIFLGAFGVHNFYAARHKQGGMQLALTLLTCFYGALVSWLWAVVEVCVVKQDGDEVAFL